MLFDFFNVIVFLLVGVGFIFGSLVASKLLRPQAPFREKLMTYECGEIPLDPGRINFNIRFYVMALVFIIFDVEIALMFPVGAVFRQWIEEGNGLLALAEISLFVLILLLGLVYIWVKGDIGWMRGAPREERNLGSEIMPRASRIP